MDTNCISDFLSAVLDSRSMDFLSMQVDKMPNISVISQIGILCWKTRDARLNTMVENFVADSNILQISPNIVEICVRIRKSKKIKTPDAIIAATAICYDYTLITRNEIDFTNIANLKVLNPQRVV